MAQKKQLEFFLLRYVPDVVKGEFVNFGLLAIEDGPDGSALVDVRFARDWGRVLCLDPQADLEVLAGLERDIRQEIGRTGERAVLFRRMEDSFSNLIQISHAMPALTEMPELEIETAARMFLESTKLKRTREPAGRQKILDKMRDAFEEVGVLDFMNPVPVEPYTKPGDPFEFDLGYRVGNEIKLFHAISLKTSVDSAVMLAARYPKIVPVMEKVTQATPSLTAVIDDDLDRVRGAVQFALSMMEEERIRVAVAAEMPVIAQVAQRDLGA